MNTPKNTRSEEELLQMREFFALKREKDGYEADEASAKGSINGVYQRAATFKLTKKQFAFAKKLEKEDPQAVVKELRDNLRVAGWMGHLVSRQTELFEADRTPQSEIAEAEGQVVGLEGRSMENPYQPGSEEGQAWQRGVNEGNALRNKEFSDAIKRSFEDDDPEDDEDDLEDGEIEEEE